MAKPPNEQQAAPLSAASFGCACRAMDDMVILAHVREQHRLSLQSYGRPRMTEELQELGLKVGHPIAPFSARKHACQAKGQCMFTCTRGDA